LHGEKNGKKIGQKLNIAVIDVGTINDDERK
jgi:hypothetical protein